MDVVKVTHQPEADKAPGKGFLPTVPLLCHCRVAAHPCCQHRSWEPAWRPAWKTKQTNAKWLWTTCVYIPWLFYCEIYCISSVNTNHVQEYHVWNFQYCSSPFFLSSPFFFSSFTDELNLKTIACMQILHIPNDCCYRASSFSGLGRSMSYNWQATASKLSPKCLTCSFVNFWGFCLRILGMAY